MKKSLEQFEKLSEQCYKHTTIYKFNKDIDASEKYRKGRITAAAWLNELIYYYISKEKNFINEFKDQIQKQKVELDNINEGEYKTAIYDQLNEIEEMIK